MRSHTFKTIDVIWQRERDGRKSNTVRRLDVSDPRYFIEEGDMVVIQNKETGETFSRTVTDVTLWDGVHIISWRHEE